ncbi:MAG: helix-turn-helix domain-containing protein [Limisphaerales bacterium]
MSELDRQFAQFLRQRRGEASFQAFARKLGIAASTLHRLENGQQSATLQRVDQILTRLKCRWPDAFHAGSGD